MALNLAGLQKFRAALPGEILAARFETAADIADLAAQLCPVDSGDLVSTIRVEPGPAATVLVKAGGVSGGATGAFVDYARYVEYGTAASPAQPFMTPAAKNIDRLFRLRARIRALAAASRIH
jgi:HK97 gp10 family phage protein